VRCDIYMSLGGKWLSATSATTTQLLSSGEFCQLRYDTIPVKKCICERFLSIPITKKSTFFCLCPDDGCLAETCSH
jgi:hypothetical protein